MQRGSDKHSARLDDEMERETRSMTQGSPIEARADESRMKEPPGDDDPTSEAIVHYDNGEDTPGLTS